MITRTTVSMVKMNVTSFLRLNITLKGPSFEVNMISALCESQGDVRIMLPADSRVTAIWRRHSEVTMHWDQSHGDVTIKSAGDSQVILVWKLPCEVIMTVGL